ncbi:MAG: hypothetical protein M1823_000291 [Watsoniomyces obsoletus]|nr:MAG: hypothetical protein M1823_000291 [Watsoniomyces obsoletus]
MPPRTAKCPANPSVPTLGASPSPKTTTRRITRSPENRHSLAEPGTMAGMKETRRETKKLARRRRAMAGLDSRSSPPTATNTIASPTLLSTQSNEATASMADDPPGSGSIASDISISRGDSGSIDDGVAEEDIVQFRRRLVVSVFGELDKASLSAVWTRPLGPNGRFTGSQNPQNISGQVSLHTHTDLQRQLQYLHSQQVAATEQAKLVISGANLIRLFFATHADCEVNSGELLTRLGVEIRRDVATFTDYADRLDRVRKYAQADVMKNRRYNEVAQNFGWMMLAMLAHSTTFRSHAATASSSTWSLVVTILHDLRGSIEMFAKARRLDWQTVLDAGTWGEPALTPEEIQNRYDTVISHPHEYYLDQEGLAQRITVEGREHINIEEHLYNEELYRRYKPPRWPHPTPFPSDPMTLYDPSMPPCHICKAAQCDTCEDLWTNPLIEIFESGDGRGRGVRALEVLHHGDALGEYIGSIEPRIGNPDTVYAMSIQPAFCEFGVISAARVGNWIRYVNHSCDYNTQFETAWSRGRYRIFLVAVRKIQPLEELTVDYGSGYWEGGRFCLCGSEWCKYGAPKKVKSEKRVEKVLGKKPTPRKKRRVAGG